MDFFRDSITEVESESELSARAVGIEPRDGALIAFGENNKNIA